MTVTDECIERVCAEVNEYTEEQLASEFERFFTAQPNVCDFVIELTNESDNKIQELSLFLSYMVFKAVESARPLQSETVSADRIDNAFKASELWLDTFNKSPEDDIGPTLLGILAREAEPNLLHYVMGEISLPLEDGSELDNEAKSEVFFVMKTVISSFSGSSGETAEENQTKIE